MQHILLQKAFNYKKRKKFEAPKGYSFDNKLGAWKDNLNHNLLIHASNFPILGTKKHDIETGEDCKGE
jgi:hypothetical protein